MKGQTSTSALKRFMNKDNTVGHVFAFPFIFGFVCFSLIPVCISFYYAFTNYSLGSKTAAFIGFKNFLRLFQDEVFLKSLAITLKYVLISVPLKLVFALIVALLMLLQADITAWTIILPLILGVLIVSGLSDCAFGC